MVEDFEGFSVGNLTSPVSLANATYTSDLPQIRENSTNNPTKRLFENGPDNEPGRVFSLFPVSTTFFGVDVASIRQENSSEILEITVEGGSGILYLLASFGSLSEFFGVSDPLGLTSVTLRNLGTGARTWAWGMDNVTVATAPIPEFPWEIFYPAFIKKK